MLINRLSKIFHNNMRTECEKCGISKSYHSILFHLTNSNGLSQLDIAHLTNLTPPTISVTLQKMEADGLIIRKNDEKDLRQMRIYITEKGINADTQTRISAKKIEEKLTASLSGTEKKELKKCLVKLCNEND